ncbi:RNHCP domain-containing protein [Enterococcus durans]|uniref:RNHCP domain-containing protein n=1 Tax=Enterococcus durans TaxID=53345 RepID=UPI0039A4BC0A
MRANENNGFICRYCNREVQRLTNGSYRNHCPFCLYSLHVDRMPGDRNSDCFGLMKPLTYRYTSKKGYQIMHKCETCGKEQWNIIAENTVQEDEFVQWVHNMIR